MLNALTSYQFEDRPVRVVMVQGEPWFVATDVATVLGYRDSEKLTRLLDEDEKGTHIAGTIKGDQSLTIINESGLYNGIFRSRREEAQRFRRWVTGEVLPELRRTGRYDLGPPPSGLPAAVSEEIDTARLTAAVGLIREARQIWGPMPTRIIWEKLGLPTPIVEARGELDADPFVDQVARVIDDKAAVTVIEVEGLLGLPISQHSFSLALRIGAALRLLGWSSRNERRDGGVVKVWRPIPRAVPAAADNQAEG